MLLKNILICALISSTSFAAKTKNRAPSSEKESFEQYVQAVTKETSTSAVQNVAELSDADVESMSKHLLEQNKRLPASADIATLSKDPAIIDFVKSVNNLKSPEELDQKLRALDQNYESLPNKTLKFYALTMIPLRTLRGLSWRMITVFPQSRVLHSVVVSAAQRMVSLQKAFLPTNEWNTLNAYLAEPYVAYKNDDPKQGGTLAPQFKSESDMQKLGVEMVAALSKATERLSKLDITDDSPVLIDKKLFFGASSFKDSIDRYRLIGGVDRIMILSGMCGAVSRLAASRAYSIYGALGMSQGIGELYGMGKILNLNPNKIEGSTAADRANIAKKHPQFDVLMPDGQRWMDLSFSFLRSSTKFFMAFTRTVKKMDASSRNESFVLDINLFKGGDREMDAAMSNMARIMAGKTTIVSHVTGESVEVDLPGFYKNPPKDLKALIPVQFEEGETWLDKTLKVNGSDVTSQYRNYSKGRPLAWNGNAYATLFPQLAGAASTPKISNYARTLYQSWGASSIDSFLLDYLQ